MLTLCHDNSLPPPLPPFPCPIPRSIACPPCRPSRSRSSCASSTAPWMRARPKAEPCSSRSSTKAGVASSISATVRMHARWGTGWRGQGALFRRRRAWGAHGRYCMHGQKGSSGKGPTQASKHLLAAPVGKLSEDSGTEPVESGHFTDKRITRICVGGGVGNDGKRTCKALMPRANHYRLRCIPPLPLPSGPPAPPSRADLDDNMLYAVKEIEVDEKCQEQVKHEVQVR